MPKPTIAVIGAGFSGSLLSLHLQATCPTGTRICLIERTGRFGPGLAHATTQPDHLLNVTADRMSALPDQPLHFLQWLQRQPEDVLLGCAPSAKAFVPRRLFGAYVSSLLAQAASGHQPNRLDCLTEQAVVITRQRAGMLLRFANGGQLMADIVVLATGNGPTLPPHPDAPVLQAAGLWQSDPWCPDALDGLNRDASVLIVGTGLTMVDLVAQLLVGGHTGPITALSRNGLLPTGHLASHAPPWALPLPLPTDLGALMRTVRREAAKAQAAGQPWQSVVDALRPFIQTLWRNLNPIERRRFIRHVRPWWEIHRHRMPPVSAARIAAARASGQLRIAAGRLHQARIVEGRAEVHFRRRRDGTSQAIQADRVITCTGPSCDIARYEDPLFRSLLRDGLCRADALRLGLDVTPDGAVRGQDGTACGRLFAIGPLTRGTWWEVTAVPNIRDQCRDMASTITEALRRTMVDQVVLATTRIGLRQAHS